MRKILFILFGLTVIGAHAQNAADTTGPWKFSGLGSLTVNQASFNNWSAGGENSIAVTSLLKFYANYQKNKFSIDNNVNLKYGMINQASYDHPRKNEDLIELNSQWNYAIAQHWSVSTLINLTTQFAPGYDYPDDSTVISRFFAPAYLTVAPGILYKPVEYFSILMTPITMRGIFVMDQTLADAGAYGVDPAKYEYNQDSTVATKVQDGNNSKIKVGAFLEFYFKKEIKTDLTLESKMNFFYNYLEDNNIPAGTTPLDFNWQTFVNYSINKWFSANFFIHLAYMPGDVFIKRNGLDGKEFDVTPNEKLQVKQTFGLGLAYNF